MKWFDIHVLNSVFEVFETKWLCDKLLYFLIMNRFLKHFDSVLWSVLWLKFLIPFSKFLEENSVFVDKLRRFAEIFLDFVFVGLCDKISEFCVIKILVKKKSSYFKVFFAFKISTLFEVFEANLFTFAFVLIPLSNFFEINFHR